MKGFKQGKGILPLVCDSERSLGGSDRESSGSGIFSSSWGPAPEILIQSGNGSHPLSAEDVF